MTHRFITKRFDTEIKSTIGADIAVKVIILGDEAVRLQIWDFGGEVRFRDFLPNYARGATGGIFMYDISNKSSLDNIEEWISIFKKGLAAEEKNIPILLVGGKLDLENERAVSNKDVKQLKKSYKFHDSIECSSKTGENVENLFQTITFAMMKYVGYIV